MVPMSVIDSLYFIGCDVDCCNYSFETPLLLSIRSGHLSAISLLINLGKSVIIKVAFSFPSN